MREYFDLSLAFWKVLTCMETQIGLLAWGGYSLEIRVQPTWAKPYPMFDLFQMVLIVNNL